LRSRQALLESARTLHARRLCRLARLHAAARALLRRGRLLRSLSGARRLHGRRAGRRRRWSGARRLVWPLARRSRLLALACALAARLNGAALALPLWRLRALAVRRTRRLLSRTVLSRQTVGPSRLLSRRAARPLRLTRLTGRPSQLLRPRKARGRGRIGAAEVALLGKNPPARGLGLMHLADKRTVARPAARQ
jgi:hypothetical protein